MLGRKMRPNCDPCRYNCSDIITDEQRQQLFDRYYGLGDLHKQWLMLSTLIDRTEPKKHSITDPPKYKRRAPPKVVQRNRVANYVYYLEGTNSERLRVCQSLFLATFDINDAVLKTAINKTNAAGELIDHDRRGFRNAKMNKNKSI